MFKKLITMVLWLPLIATAWEPTKPVTAIIGFQVGSSNELGFRVVANQVQKIYPNFKYVVEIKPGADSVIATNLLEAAAPDGYTIGIPSYMSTYVTNDIWQRDIKKFQWNSITSVMGLGKSPMAIVANPTSLISSPNDLNRLLRSTTKPITFAVGAGAHRMAWEFIMDKSHGNRSLVTFAQYQGPLPAVTAVASDAGIEFGIMPLGIALPLIESGKVKLIGVSGNKKTAGADPYLVDGQHVNIHAAWALALPPNTPREIVEWYNRAFNQALQTPEVQQYFRKNYIYVEPSETTVDGLNKHLQDLRATWMPMAPRLMAK
jgi:tripartite-type tricarboxylate transporter receptor subunit TctC